MIRELLSTKFIILMEIAASDHHSLSGIADKIGITKQAVSDYVKKMRQDGLVANVDGKYRITHAGVEKLFEWLKEIEEYISKGKKRMEMMEYFSAIAGNNIKKGERVSLVMKNGFLYAFSSLSSPCHATAIEDAIKGDEVLLKDIEGIIDMSIGKIYLIELPSPEKGGSKMADIQRAKKFIDDIKADKMAVLDITGKVLFGKIGIKPDFEFDAVASSINAAYRGLDVIIIGGENEIRKAIAKLEELNASSVPKIEYEIFDARL